MKRLAVILSVVALLLRATASLAVNYTVVSLSSNNWSYSESHGINDLGNVVGEYEATNSNSVLTFLWDKNALTDIGHLNGQPYAIAHGINHGIAVVGESDVGLVTHAFVYTNGAMTDLGTLGNIAASGYSSAQAINNLDQIVGEASLSDVSVIHAVLYAAGGKTDLGALGGNYSSAAALNRAGVIVGESDIVQAGVTNVHAFVYTNGAGAVMRDLGTLGGAYSSAQGINDSGVIVGESETLIGGVTYLRGFICSNGVMNALGTFGGSSSSASAINSSGLVVGYATDTNEVAHAFLYDGNNMVDLNTLLPPGTGWTNLSSADAINDAGEIAGSGYLSDGSYYAYLLKPAPPLTVTVTNPAPNARFPVPATFTIQASATDTGGTVTNVEFLVNGNKIGDSTTPPYSATATNLPAGTYLLTAVASDNAGLFATNSIDVTVATPAPFSLTTPTFDATGFSFSFQTQTGFTYTGEFTTRFGATNNWVVFTNLAGNGSVVRVTNSAGTNTQGFYRVLAY